MKWCVVVVANQGRHRKTICYVKALMQNMRQCYAKQQYDVSKWWNPSNPLPFFFYCFLTRLPSSRTGNIRSSLPVVLHFRVTHYYFHSNSFFVWNGTEMLGVCRMPVKLHVLKWQFTCFTHLLVRILYPFQSG